MQRINAATKTRVGRKKWRPRGEVEAMQLVKWLRRKLHRDQKLRGDRAHHEQSAASRFPFDGAHWPWAVSSEKEYMQKSVVVSGCAVGLMDHNDELLLAKAFLLYLQTFHQ